MRYPFKITHALHRALFLQNLGRASAVRRGLRSLGVDGHQIAQTITILAKLLLCVLLLMRSANESVSIIVNPESLTRCRSNSPREPMCRSSDFAQRQESTHPKRSMNWTLFAGRRKKPKRIQVSPSLVHPWFNLIRRLAIL